MAVAHEERLLGRLDEQVDVLEGFLAHTGTQTVEDREDHERREPLRRRREVVRGADREGGGVGGDDDGAVPLQIVATHRAVQALELGDERARDVAAVEVVEPVRREPFERRGEGREGLEGACLGRPAGGEVGRREAGLADELRQEARGVIHLVLRHGNAVARMADRIGEQSREGEATR
jgi:hypothetical protein